MKWNRVFFFNFLKKNMGRTVNFESPLCDMPVMHTKFVTGDHALIALENL